MEIPYQDALTLASSIKSTLFKDGFTVYITGSLRRQEKFIETLSFLSINGDLKDLFTSLINNYNVFPIKGSDSFLSANFKDKEDIQLDFYSCTKGNLGSFQLYLTGSASFNIALRSVAKRKTLSLNQYGLFDKDNNLLPSFSEEDLFNQLGYKYIPPAKRSINSLKQAYIVLGKYKIKPENISEKLYNSAFSCMNEVETSPFYGDYSENLKYSKVLNNPEFFRERGAEAEIVMMPPHEYLQRVADGFGRSVEWTINQCKKEKVLEYSNYMNSGERKFPIPILVYNHVRKTFLQEGRHRALAAHSLGIEKIPVCVIVVTKECALQPIDFGWL